MKRLLVNTLFKLFDYSLGLTIRTLKLVFVFTCITLEFLGDRYDIVQLHVSEV